MVRRDKLVLSFDESARKSFITGFRARRAQRVRAAERGRAAAARAATLEARAARRAAAGGAPGDIHGLTTVHEEPDWPRAEERTTPADAFSARVFGANFVRVTVSRGVDAGAGAGGADVADAAEEEALRAVAARHQKQKRRREGAAAGPPAAAAARAR